MAVEPPEEVITDAMEEAEHGDGEVRDHVLDRMEITWDTDAKA
mgnify:FL=1|jgi:hypothetical protein